MAQSNGDEKLREKVQDICDRVGAGLLPPTGAGAIMQLILADRKQHELQAKLELVQKINQHYSKGSVALYEDNGFMVYSDTLERDIKQELESYEYRHQSS